jgi:hypothetical protein
LVTTLSAVGIAIMLGTAAPGAQVPWPPFEALSALKLDVTPQDADVYVDGYLTGTVDDFDGFFQRLRLPAGEHDIELYKDGHRSGRQKVYLEPGATFRLRHALEPLKPGETSDPRPTPPQQSVSASRPGGPPDYRRPRPPRGPQDLSRAGSVSLRVQPADAEILIDGERWDSSGEGGRLVVQVTPGPHRIEVRKTEYETFASEIDVHPGETSTVNVSLSRRR